VVRSTPAPASASAIERRRLLLVGEVLTMRFHLTGLVVFVAFLVLALTGGAGPAVAVVASLW
jgi:hypothetical protein